MERPGAIQVSGDARRGPQSSQVGQANNVQGTVHSFGYCVSMVSWSQKKSTGGESEGSLFLSVLELSKFLSSSSKTRHTNNRGHCQRDRGI